MPVRGKLFNSKRVGGYNSRSHIHQNIFLYIFPKKVNDSLFRNLTLETLYHWLVSVPLWRISPTKKKSEGGGIWQINRLKNHKGGEVGWSEWKGVRISPLDTINCLACLNSDSIINPKCHTILESSYNFLKMHTSEFLIRSLKVRHT